MRVSSGIYKGREINVPRSGVKPTSDKVRQAIMNILQNRIRGIRFLDLYCGTGSVGIEALSCGASYSVFVEDSNRVYRFLKQNLDEIIGDKSIYKTYCHNALNLSEILNSNENFDVIFADPFYRDADDHFEDLYKSAIPFLNTDGIFIIEHGSRTDFSSFPLYSGSRDYGDTHLSIFEKNGRFRK